MINLNHKTTIEIKFCPKATEVNIKKNAVD